MFNEAWERFKDLLRQCPHHGFSKLHQLDTFYNAFNPNDQDAVDSAAGGNFLDKIPRECLSSQKLAVGNFIQNHQNVSNQTRPPGFHQSTQQNNNQNRFQISNLNQNRQPNQGAIYQNRPPQNPNFQALPQQNTVTQGKFKAYTTANDANMNKLQLKFDNFQRNQQDFQKKFEQKQDDFHNQMMQFMQNLYNKPSTSSSSLPSNTIPNLKGEVKAITTRSGMSYKEPPIPPKGVNQQEPVEVTTDTEPQNSDDIHPPTVQAKVQIDKLAEEPVVVIPKAKPNLPYPSRLQKEKLQEKDDILAAKFMEIFRDLHFELSFTDALIHMPKFAPMFKNLLNNKYKLIELTKMPLNENCSAIVLKKLPEKLGDPAYCSISSSNKLSSELILVFCLAENLSLELHQLDTFYNALNPNDQDALDSAAGGNFLDKIPRECLSIIKSKSKVKYSRSRVTDVRANANAPLSSFSHSNSFDLQQIAAALEDKLDIRMNRFEKSLNEMKNSLVTPTAPLKAVTKVCVTCRSNHSYNQCPLTRGGNDFPKQDDFQNQMMQFMQNLYNKPSTSSSLPSNTIPNLKGESKAITTRSDATCEEYSQVVLGFTDDVSNEVSSPIYKHIVSNSSQNLTPFDASDFLLLEEADAFIAIDDESISSNIDATYYDPKGDILILEALLDNDPEPLSNQKDFFPTLHKDLKVVEPKNQSEKDEPPEVELKELPPHLKYAFLGDNGKWPVIIAKDLSSNEKTDLINVLKMRKKAIAWKLTDIKGIDLEFYSHKILLEEDYSPKVQSQRRVNPKIHDVIKKEVEKLLDAGLIYPISDSPWVSPIHCVPKKGGMTVIKNDENELVPLLTRNRLESLH
nr:reverse transcriptase domain-containing protein [Tanacetum cinerariifolium]